MSRPYRALLAAWVLGALALFGLASSGRSTARVTIFHTNDVHGWILPHVERGGASGGMAALAGYLSRQAKPHLLLDAGDLYQGTPEGSLTKGEAVVDCMNALAYDAAAVGNHEFDDGADNLAKLAAQADFPLLAANLKDRKDRLGRIKPWIIKDVDGVRVGIFGLVTSRSPEVVMAKNVADLEFEAEKPAAERAVAELRAAGAELVVALTHIGLERPGEDEEFDDADLGEQVPGIDVIVGGHSHTFLREPVKAGGALVVQAGSQLRHVGRLAIDWDRKARRAVRTRYHLVPLDGARWGEEANMASLVKYYRDAASGLLGRDLERVVGEAAADITRDYDAESAAGNWHADVLRAAAGADVAFFNAGGIRHNVYAGPVRVRDLYQVSPFGNTLVVMRLRASAIWDILENAAAGGHGMLQVSGLRFEYDPSRPAGSRVTGVWVGGAPYGRGDRSQLVATNSFLAQGGDGYDAFKTGWEMRETGRTVFDLLVQDFEKNSPVSARVEGRIRRLP